MHTHKKASMHSLPYHSLSLSQNILTISKCKNMWEKIACLFQFVRWIMIINCMHSSFVYTDDNHFYRILLRENRGNKFPAWSTEQLLSFVCLLCTNKMSFRVMVKQHFNKNSRVESILWILNFINWIQLECSASHFKWTHCTNRFYEQRIRKMIALSFEFNLVFTNRQYWN